MSQKQIPQPASTGPAQVFESTDDNSPTPNVSAIGTAGPPPAEVPPHTGAVNTLDITVHRQFIPTDTFTWTTSQLKDTLLWYQPIHPYYANPFLKYLSKMYNCWGGGIEYNFKVAGTGFHAGAIAIVRIPPNRHPKEFQNSSSWGAFEYMVIDPKTLEVISAHLIDQRPITFHYQPYNIDVPNSFGGWVAAFVLIPLNTSSSGSQQIAVQVFARPGQDFQYSQMIYPYLENAVTRNQIPEDFFNYVLSGNRRMSYLPLDAKNLIVNPSSIVQLTMGFSGCYDSKGKPLFKEYPVPAEMVLRNTPYAGIKILKDLYIAYYTGTYNAILIRGTWPQPLTIGYTYLFPSHPIVSGNITGDAAGWIYEGPDDNGIPRAFVARPDSAVCVIESDGKVGGTLSNVFSADFKQWAPTSMFVCYPTEQGEMIEAINGSPIAPPIPESIVTFRAGNVSSMSLASIQVAMLTGMFDHWLPSADTAILLVVYDVVADLPVLYLKMYSNGLITASPIKDQLTLDITRLAMKFSGFIRSSDPIPTSRDTTLNLYTTLPFHSNPAHAYKEKITPYKNGSSSIGWRKYY